MPDWTFNDISAATLGISGVRRTRVSQDADTLTFSVARSMTDDAPFAFGDTVVVKYGDTGFFHGRVITIPRAGDGGAESLQYTLAGPWWYLDNLVFQQPWRVAINPADPESALENADVSSALLNRGADGLPISTGNQITATLDYAITCGAPFAYQLVDFPVLAPPSDYMQDASCSEIIKKMLRWTPDAATWFDYTVTPPKLYIRRRNTAAAKTYDLGAGQPNAALDITARPDLVPPAVVFKYRWLNSEDSRQFVRIETDAAGGSPTSFGAVVMTFNLAGSAAVSQEQGIRTAAISPSSLAWWRTKLPWLPADAVIEDGSSDAPLGFGNEIIGGAVPEWAVNASAVATVQAKATYTITDAVTGASIKHVKQPVSVRLTTTSFSTQVLWTMVTTQEAEDAPSGLAAAYYDSVSQLHYQGSFTLVCAEAVLDAAVAPGCVLNLTGGRAEWAAMRAHVQQVTDDVDQGLTTLSFGPPAQLGPQDLVEQLRINRTRDDAAGSMGVLRTGGAAGNKVRGADQTPNDSAAAGNQSPLILKLAKDADNYIQLDPDAGTLTAKFGGKALTLAKAALTEDMTARKVSVIVDGATVKKVLALVGPDEDYDPPATVVCGLTAGSHITIEEDDDNPGPGVWKISLDADFAARLDTDENDIADLIADVATLFDDVTDLQTASAGHDVTLGSLQGQINTLNTNLASLSTASGAIYDQINATGGIIDTINGILDRLDDASISAECDDGDILVTLDL